MRADQSRCQWPRCQRLRSRFRWPQATVPNALLLAAVAALATATLLAGCGANRSKKAEQPPIRSGPAPTLPEDGSATPLTVTPSAEAGASNDSNASGVPLPGAATNGPATPVPIEDPAVAEKRNIDAVKATIVGWHRAFSAALLDPAAPHPELAQWLAAPLLGQAYARLADLAARHMQARPPANSRAMIEILAATPKGEGVYSVTTCELDDAALFDVTTNQQVAGGGVYKGAWTLVQQADGHWLITESNATAVASPGLPSDSAWAQACRSGGWQPTSLYQVQYDEWWIAIVAIA